MNLSATRTVLACLVALASARAAAAQCPEATLAPGDPAAGDEFGDSVAIEGATLVVGQPRRVTSVFDDDAAYVYERGPAGWTQTAKLQPLDAPTGQDFGEAVALAADTVIVGDPGAPGLSFLEGAAYFFERTPSGWVQTQKVFASDGAFGDRFGVSVALSPDGNRALIGAPGGDAAPNTPEALLPGGAAYVFDRTPTGWVEAAKLVVNNGDWTSALFGWSVAIEGDTAAVSHPFYDEYSDVPAPPGTSNDKFDVGRVWVFARTPSGWVERVELEPDPSDLYPPNFGYDVDLEGARLLVGARGEDERSGSVYVFERGSAGWAKTARVEPADGAPEDAFGSAVALDGDTFVASSIGTPPFLSLSGAAYTFALGAGGWEQTGKVASPSGVFRFAQSCAADERTALFGAPSFPASSDPNGSAVYVHRLPGARLDGTPASLSVAAGGVHALVLDTCPPRVGQPYVVIGTAGATSPGVLVDGVLLPLTLDQYTILTLTSANSGPFVNTFGTLDAAGSAAPSIVLPTGAPSSLAGAALNHAAVVLELTPTLLRVDVASNPVQLDLIP